MSQDKDHRRHYVLQIDLQELGMSKSLVQRITKGIPFSTLHPGGLRAYSPERIIAALTDETQKQGIRPATREKLLRAIGWLWPKKANVVEVDFAKNLTLDEQRERAIKLCEESDAKMVESEKELEKLMIRTDRILSQGTKTDSRSPKRKAKEVELRPIPFLSLSGGSHPFDKFAVNLPALEQTGEVQTAILDLLAGFEEAVAKAEKILAPNDEPQNHHVDWAIEKGTKAYLQCEADDCNSEIAENMEKLEELAAELDKGAPPSTIEAKNYYRKIKTDEYEEKLAKLNQRANAILQDEPDEVDEPQGNSPDWSPEELAQLKQGAEDWLGQPKTSLLAKGLTKGLLAELDSRVQKEVEKFNRFLDSVENEDISDMDGYLSRAIRMSNYSSLHSKLNSCESEIAEDVRKLNLIQNESIWTPPHSLALWASAKQRAERLIKEWSDEDAQEKSEIEYFKSEGDRIIYALVELDSLELDGEARCNALGVTKAHILSKEVATEWRNNLAKVIHPDICHHPKAGEAFTKLTEMYEWMTRTAQKDEPKIVATPMPEETEELDDSKITQADLAQFSGTFDYYQHWSKSFVYTDGVQYLAEKAEAYWLLDAIASYQQDKRIRNNPDLLDFQLWELEVQDESAELTLLRDAGEPILSQHISFTDFPLEKIKLYLSDGVLLLPSEY